MSYLEHQAAYPPPEDTPTDSSVAFVLSRPDDETLVFSIEFDGQEPGEEISRADHDNDGWSGVELLKETVERTAAAIGARVVNR